MVSKEGRKLNCQANLKEKELPLDSNFQFKAKSPAAQPVSPSVTKAAASSSQIGAQLLVEGKVAVNPFSLVGSDRWSGCPKARVDANPASLKRARAAEFYATRTSSKPSKGKGRATTLSKVPSPKDDIPPVSDPSLDIVTHEVALSTLKGSLVVSRRDSSDLRETGSQGGVDPMESAPMETAELPLDLSGDAPMDSDLQPASQDQVECQLPDQGVQVQCPDSDGISDMLMSGTQGET